MLRWRSDNLAVLLLEGVPLKLLLSSLFCLYSWCAATCMDCLRTNSSNTKHNRSVAASINNEPSVNSSGPEEQVKAPDPPWGVLPARPPLAKGFSLG